MAKNTIFSQFTGLYPVSKTLRFELKPIGKTFLVLFFPALSKDSKKFLLL